jgi:hypothetical protein
MLSVASVEENGRKTMINGVIDGRAVEVSMNNVFTR